MIFLSNDDRGRFRLVNHWVLTWLKVPVILLLTVHVHAG